MIRADTPINGVGETASKRAELTRKSIITNFLNSTSFEERKHLCIDEHVLHHKI